MPKSPSSSMFSAFGATAKITRHDSRHITHDRIFMQQAIRIRIVSVLLCCAALPVATWAQEFDFNNLDFGGLGGEVERDPVNVSAQFTTATADRPAILMVTAKIDPEWHVYSLTQPKGGPMRTKITLTESDMYLPIGDWQAFPEPHSRIDQVVWKGLTIEEHDDQVTWYLPIEIAEGVDPKQLTIDGKVTLQACKEACIRLNFDFTAKQGDGIEIGPVDVTAPSNVATQAATTPAPEPATVLTPPAEAGVFRADGSAVTWYGWVDRRNVQPGGRTNLILRADMPKRWHINAYAPSDDQPGNKPTLIALDPLKGTTAFKPESRSTLIEKDSPVAGFGQLAFHEDTAVWVVPIDFAADLALGDYNIDGLVGYQACESNDQGLGSCELAKGARFSATISVGDSESSDPATVSFAPAKYSEASDLAAKTANSIKDAAPVAGQLQIIEFNPSSNQDNLGLMGMLGAALVGGLILNLMPCVLPVIGLKIMGFAKQGGESRGRVFVLNLAYVAGLLSVFLLLATLASLTQWGIGQNDYEWGELNTQTWFKVSMTSLVFVMALSFLGVWEIPLPGFAGSSTATEMASREGLSGAFFKGILTTILATPCSGPFLGPVFGFTIGQSQGVTYLIFLFVGLGMALPYLIIGAFPALVQWIPKPGMWMETFKQFMAFVLLGTVVYLLSTINPDYYIATMALLVALWFACWLGGRQPITASTVRRWSAWGLGCAFAVIVGLVGFTWDREYELPWKEFSASQLAESRASGRPVLVEFTANWCPTCNYNLLTALDVAAVKKVVEANGVEALKADWTDEDETIEHALAELRSRSIPLLAIYPAGRPDEVLVLRDTVTKTQVLQALAVAGATKSNPEQVPVGDSPMPRTASSNPASETR